MPLKKHSFFGNPLFLALTILGFASGLPLALTASTLSYWLTDAKVDITTIGLFGIVATPYALKFLWSPLVDGTRFPVLSKLLGARRGWLIGAQLLLMIAIMLLGFADPAINPWATAFFALLVAIASATQDIVADAFRVESLKEEEQGLGAASFVFGYRLGMIVSTAVALHLSVAYGWQVTYFIMALLLIAGMVTVLFMREPEHRVVKEQSNKTGAWLRHYVWQPFAEFMQRKEWWLFLLFIVLFKLSDAFLGMMTGPFYLFVGFTKTQIADYVKLSGMLATIAGAFLGGWLIARVSLSRALFISLILQGVTNLVFVSLLYTGPDVTWLVACVIAENVGGGIGTAVFMAFLAKLCNREYTATQYALMSSFASIGRTWISAASGFTYKWLGWQGLFVFSAFLALPALILLLRLRRNINYI